MDSWGRHFLVTEADLIESELESEVKTTKFIVERQILIGMGPQSTGFAQQAAMGGRSWRIKNKKAG